MIHFLCNSLLPSWVILSIICWSIVVRGANQAQRVIYYRHALTFMDAGWGIVGVVWTLVYWPLMLVFGGPVVLIHFLRTFRTTYVPEAD